MSCVLVVPAREAEVGDCELKTSHNVQPQTAQEGQCLQECVLSLHLSDPLSSQVPWERRTWQ